MTGPDGIESDSAALVESVLGSEGVVLGRREYEPGDLTIDFVYPQASPRPIALEITTHRFGHLAEGTKAMRALEHSLNTWAAERDVGCWFITVDPSAQHGRLKPVIKGLILRGIEIRPGEYTAEDVRREEAAGTYGEFLEQHRCLSRLGIVEVQRISNRERRIEILGLSGASPLIGFTSALEEILAANRHQLDSITVRILEKNLSVIDDAIGESLDALRADPGNLFLETHLERSIRAKGDYLRDAALLVGWIS